MKLSTILLALVGVKALPAEGTFARELFELHNQMRQDPESFIPELENILSEFDGSRYRKLVIGEKTYRVATLEADLPVRELIYFLKKQPKLQPLVYDDLLQGYACQHVKDQGATRDTGHESTVGESWEVRIAPAREAGSKTEMFGENLTYGAMSARDALLTLAINDGVSTRAHRKNIFTADYTKIGVCKGDHIAFSNMVDVIFKG